MGSLISYEIRLPYPPSINRYWRRVGPRVLISRGGRKYREEVAHLVAESGIEMVRDPCALTIHLFPPDRRRRDIDNTLKALLDALEHGGALENDSLVERLEVNRENVTPGGEAIVLIQHANGGGLNHGRGPSSPR